MDKNHLSSCSIQNKTFLDLVAYNKCEIEFWIFLFFQRKRSQNKITFLRVVTRYTVSQLLASSHCQQKRFRLQMLGIIPYFLQKCHHIIVAFELKSGGSKFFSTQILVLLPSSIAYIYFSLMHFTIQLHRFCIWSCFWISY